MRKIVVEITRLDHYAVGSLLSGFLDYAPVTNERMLRRGEGDQLSFFFEFDSYGTRNWREVSPLELLAREAE